MNLRVIDFSGQIQCSSAFADKFYTVCNSFSFEFETGAYVLQGEIDCGSWAFLQILENGNTENIDDYSRLYWNNQRIDLDEIQKYVWCVDRKEQILKSRATAFDVITYLAKKTKNDRGVNEWLEQFEVCKDEVVDCNRHTYPIFKTIEGLMLGKKIFTTVWHGQCCFDAWIYNKICRAINKEDTIFLIASSERNILDKGCKTITMNSLFKK